jgi:hypothetical protein
MDLMMTLKLQADHQEQVYTASVMHLICFLLRCYANTVNQRAGWGSFFLKYRLGDGYNKLGQLQA